MYIQLKLDFLDNFFFGFIRCSFEQYSLSSISLTDNSVRNFWEEKGYHLLPENEYVQEAGRRFKSKYSNAKFSALSVKSCVSLREKE